MLFFLMDEDSNFAFDHRGHFVNELVVVILLEQTATLPKVIHQLVAEAPWKLLVVAKLVAHVHRLPKLGGDFVHPSDDTADGTDCVRIDGCAHQHAEGRD